LQLPAALLLVTQLQVAFQEGTELHLGYRSGSEVMLLAAVLCRNLL
jgi:hypothetical protein